MKQRLLIVDCMQGIAMILVIVGHHLFPIMPEWYHQMHYYIYTFHMPLFIFISGFLIRYSYHGVNDTKEYWQYVYKKIKKFLPAYLAVGCLCIGLSKEHFSFYHYIKEVAILLISPLESEAVFLWYIYLLMIYYAISPLIIPLLRKKRLILLLSFILPWLPIQNNYFCIDYFCKFTQYYVIGMACAEYLYDIRFERKWAGMAMMLFVIFSIVHFNIIYTPVLEYALSWLGIPSVFYLSYLIKKRSSWMTLALAYISKHCFGIYLLHMFFVQSLFLLLYEYGITLDTTTAIAYIILSTVCSIIQSSICWLAINQILHYDFCRHSSL